MNTSGNQHCGEDDSAEDGGQNNDGCPADSGLCCFIHGVGCVVCLMVRVVVVVSSGLTVGTQPRRPDDVTRDSGTESVRRRWLE